ncbi:hypothetical protein QBC43DRAFT_269711 [Cladorrhinum sp. PSN259]|nr:hypothetical protein QBC43DRAFT_269711 [Cladorrhinum sp. PSN259]
MSHSRNKLPRRKHTKSRYGCQECKKRHMKCDESRPSCVNCNVSNLQCSFSTNRPTLPTGICRLMPPSPSSRSSTQESQTSPTPSSAPSPYPSPQTESTPLLSPPRSPPGSASQHDVFTERYSLLHLELLNHFQTQLLQSIGLDQMVAVVRLTVTEAFANPFLMDQLLALSAAHKSTLPDTTHLRDHYRTEATRLQTRALAQFNETQASLSDKDPMPVFLFSTFLGQHVLYDTLQQVSSHEGDMAALIDTLGQCLSIHHGIAHIAGQSWTELTPRLPPEFEEHKERHLEASDLANNPESECYPLMQLLKGSQMDESSVQDCALAVERLQQLIHAQRSFQMMKLSEPLINFVQEWPVRVPQGYITLVKERRPEALMVLAHYSVLLHQARDCWVVGNAGSFLIRSIRDYLPDWRDWLEWPISCIGGTGWKEK